MSAAGRDVLDRLGSVGVVPVVTLDRAEDAAPLAEALLAGGLPIAEVTLRTTAAVEAIRRMVDAVPDVLVGAGTVMTEDDVAAAVAAGARFVVSPGLDDGVVRAAAEHGVPALPGIATATELLRASRLGLDVVKLFPAAHVGGPDLVRALGAVWPDVRFVPTGGVTLDTVPDWLALPQVLAVGGSWMVRSAWVAAGDWDAVAAAAARARDAVRSVREAW